LPAIAANLLDSTKHGSIFWTGQHDTSYSEGHGMVTAVRFSDSTFRPEIDRCIAADGPNVVLRYTRESLVLLHFDAGHWIVAEHRAAGEAPFANSMAWRGRQFLSDGKVIEEFDDHSSDADWARLYAML
jgi:hypothetical protein